MSRSIPVGNADLVVLKVGTAAQSIDVVMSYDMSSLVDTAAKFKRPACEQRERHTLITTLHRMSL